jgi:hypothetical protein
MIAKLNRRKAAILSLAFLALAFLSKFYSGPFWRFADAYLGDVFIVACLYFGLSFVFPRKKPIIKFLVIAVFAVAIEFFQATGLPAALQLPKPFVFILGTSYDEFDFVCYLFGLAIAILLDVLILQSRSHK